MNDRRPAPPPPPNPTDDPAGGGTSITVAQLASAFALFAGIAGVGCLVFVAFSSTPLVAAAAVVGALLIAVAASEVR